MALECPLTYRGLSAPNAYHRIVSISILVPGKIVDIRYESYASDAARQAGVGPLESGSESFLASDFDSFVATGAKILTVAYGALKTRPRFAGAIDV